MKILNMTMICLVCNLKNNFVNVPFTRCDNNELIDINDTSSMSFLEPLRNVEIVNETSKFSNMAYNEANIELLLNSQIWHIMRLISNYY